MSINHIKLIIMKKTRLFINIFFVSFVACCIWVDVPIIFKILISIILLINFTKTLVSVFYHNAVIYVIQFKNNDPDAIMNVLKKLQSKFDFNILGTKTKKTKI